MASIRIPTILGLLVAASLTVYLGLTTFVRVVELPDHFTLLEVLGVTFLGFLTFWVGGGSLRLWRNMVRGPRCGKRGA